MLFLEISRKTIKGKDRFVRIHQIPLMHLLANEIYIQYIAGNMYTDFPWFLLFWLWKLSVFIIPIYLHVFFKIIPYPWSKFLFGKIVCHPNTINQSNVHSVSWNILYMTAYDKINLTTTVVILNPFNSLGPGDTYVYQWTGPSMVQVLACHLCGAEPLPESMLNYCELDHWKLISVKF